MPTLEYLRLEIERMRTRIDRQRQGNPPSQNYGDSALNCYFRRTLSSGGQASK